MKTRAGLPRFRSHVLLAGCAALIVLLTTPSAVAAATKPSPCDASWSEIVTRVHEVVEQSPKSERVVLFASQDGDVFDCLNFQVPDTLLQELQFWEVARSKTISSLTSDEDYDDSGPINYCNLSYGHAAGVARMMIHLPAAHNDVRSAKCSKRLERMPDAVSKFLKGQ